MSRDTRPPREAAAGPWGPEQDDLADGDLGYGLGRRPGGIYEVQVSRLFLASKSSDGKDSSPPPPREGEGSRGALHQCSRQLSGQGVPPEEPRLPCYRRQSSPDSNSELSNAELRHRLREALEEIEILKTELEAFRRQLEGKEEALKILQSMAVLDRATSHTQAVLQKTVEQKRSLEKEINVLQWEIEFDHNRFKNIEESWVRKCDRLSCENAVLKETLKLKTEEVKMLKSENAILNQHYLETLAMLDLRQPRTAEERAPRDLSAHPGVSGLELAVLGACLCCGPGESPCSCAEMAASTQQTLLQLRQELQLSRKRAEEAYITADAFRIAFEQQLTRTNDQALKWMRVENTCDRATKRTNWTHLQEAGLPSPRTKKTFGQKLLKMLPIDNSSKRTEDQDNPQEVLKMLVDLLNDKEEALAHQRKVSYMLARALEGKNSASEDYEGKNPRKESFPFKPSWRETADVCLLPHPVHSGVQVVNPAASLCPAQHLCTDRNYPRTLTRSCSLPSGLMS